MLLFLGSIFLCVECYNHRNDPGWNSRKAWAARYKRKEEDEKYANLTPEQRQAMKEWEIDCEFWKAKIAEEIKNAKPLDPSYWANTFDPNTPKKEKRK